MSGARWSPVLLLAAAILLCVPGGPLAAQPLAVGTDPQQSDGDAVAVEAVGLAPMPAGKPLADVHRDALLDARLNAVIQAHVVVQAQDRVEGGKLQESLVRANALGYVQEMHVWEAGPVAGSDPPLYRVRVRALVRPLPSFSAQAALGQNRREPWQPVVALSLAGDLGEQDLGRAKATLSDSLHRCGIRVQEPAAASALALHVSATSLPQSGGRGVVADWELGVGANPAGSEGIPPAGVYVGHWATDPGQEGDALWRRVGLMIAQDAIRLWTAPRWTSVRFLNPTRAQAEALAHSFGQGQDVRVRSADDLSELTVGLPITGDPMVALDAFVRRAGMSREVEPAESSLTHVTYRCLPVRRPAHRANAATMTTQNTAAATAASARPAPLRSPPEPAVR